MTALSAVRAACFELRATVAAGAARGQGDVDLNRRPDVAGSLVNTLTSEPAVLTYTSGTTGPPKGALLAHCALLGNLTGFICSQNWFGFDGVRNTHSDAVFWSSADRAWTAGLMHERLPTLYFGRPIVACAGRFSSVLALTLMASQAVTWRFLLPTALKAMMKAFPHPRRLLKLAPAGASERGRGRGGGQRRV